MTKAEVCDRFSICKLKNTRTDIDVSEELELLEKVISSYSGLNVYIDQLTDINGSIWDLESDIRRGKEGALGLEEVGRRALQIRNFNGMRVQCKNYINELHGEGFTEIKKNHASE